MHKWFQKHRAGKAFLGLMTLSLVLVSSGFRILAVDGMTEMQDQEEAQVEDSETELEMIKEDGETADAAEISMTGESDKADLTETNVIEGNSEGASTEIEKENQTETGTVEKADEEVSTETGATEESSEGTSIEVETESKTEISESHLAETETETETEEGTEISTETEVGTETETEEETETSTETETEEETETSTETETETEETETEETETETETEEDKERTAQIVSVLFPTDFTLLMYENSPGSGCIVLESTDLLIINAGDGSVDVDIEDIVFEVNQEKASGQDKKLTLEIMEYGKDMTTMEVSSEHGITPFALSLDGCQPDVDVRGLYDRTSELRAYSEADAPNYCVMRLKGELGSGSWNENDIKVKIVYRINQPEE